MSQKKKWIWEHSNYRSFPYDLKALLPYLNQLTLNLGQVKALINLLNTKDKEQVKLDLITSEIVSTSAIEGEYLSRESVRSSLCKQLNFELQEEQDSSSKHTDALAEVLIDATTNHNALQLDRMHQWHKGLLSNTFNTFHKVNTGTFRDYDDMQVVSGSVGKEKVHYIGLPYKRIDNDITSILEYINTSNENIFIKSALTHLWFVSIHPYDDGNGRMARLLSDYVLAQEFSLEFKYFSIATAIAKQRKSYYAYLEKSQNLQENNNFDFTSWLQWYLEMFNDALEDVLQEISAITNRTKFWDKMRNTPLNKRQLKVINRLLQYGEGNFEGGLTTKKYIAMTKTSVATAKRDIQELLNYQCIYQIEGTKGRNVSYDISMP